ncbi:MAG: hypothetical protein MRZ84_01250 [Eubacterium sp.]|nr:hypothetical protein [Eubacterium sp.]
MRKKNLVTAVLVASMLVGSLGVTSTPADAKSKIKLSTTRVSLNGGASKTIKIKGTKKKVKWSVVSGKKNIKLKNKKKTSVKIVGVKRGTAKVQAKLGKKKYICRVTVRKSTPAKTITITTADTQTAEVVHNALNTGKAVNLKVKGSKSSAGNLMSQLSKAVGKYNGYGVVIQRSSSKRTATSTYTTYSISSYDAQLYKYGVLLTADIVNNLKWWYSQELSERKKSLQNEETSIKSKYAVGSDNYKTIFKEITGIPYDNTVSVNGGYAYSADLNYKDGQTAKPKQQTLYYDSRIKLDNTWSLPQDYYYITFTINGKQYTSTSELGWELDRTKYNEESDLDNPDNYFLHHTTEDGVESRVYYKDVTFHYEPLTVDTAKVESTINSKIQSELEAYKTSVRYDDSVEPILTTPFLELSQAYQMYYICQAFGEGEVNGKEDWTAYAYGKAASMRGGKYRGMKNPKGRVDAGDGLSGAKAMLNHKWMGVCQDYTRMEITMYNLFGIKNTAYISCKGCDHSWSAVMVVNSRGERAWLKNDSGSTKSGYKTVPYCSKHDSKAERIDNFVN